MNILQSINQSFNKILHINDTPHKIAAGFALGAFIGIFPTFGAGGVLAAALSTLLKYNFVSAVAGAFIIMNPVTTPVFWFLSAFAGSLIFNVDAHALIEAIKSGAVFNSLGKYLIVYLAGSSIISLVVSFLSYFILKKFLEARKKETVR